MHKDNHKSHHLAQIAAAAAFVVLATTLPAATGWSQTNLSPASLSEATKTKIFEALRKNTSTVNFATKSSTLTPGEIENITAVVNAAKNTGVVSRVIVAAWSDQEYPTGKGANLSKEQIDLAKARAEGIKQALEKLEVKNIETFTMTENPSWFGRLFNTDETKIKGAGQISDPDDRLLEEIGRTIKEQGGVGKAVVIVRQAGEGLTH
jgi:outer membrane protein OmpA-like peptidoglycan-associated protein